MSSLKQSWLALGVLGLLAGIGAAALVWSTGYSVPEMDWDSDGNTSVAEMWAAVDIGRRPVRQNGRDCDEFYRKKDGLPVRVLCVDPAKLGQGRQ